MIQIFQALDALGVQKVLLLAVSELEIIPSVGEELAINDKDFVVIGVKHQLSTPELTQTIEILVSTAEALIEVEYIGEGQSDEYY